MALKYTIITSNKHKRYVLLPEKPSAEIRFEIGKFDQERKEEGYRENTAIGIHSAKRRKQAKISTLQTRIQPAAMAHSTPIKRIQNPIEAESGDQHLFISQHSQSPPRSLGRNGGIASSNDVQHGKNAKPLKINSREIGPRTSVSRNAKVEISAGKECRLSKDSMYVGACHQEFPKGDVGRGLNLLVEAIRLLESEEVHKAQDLGVQKKGLVSDFGGSVLRQGENSWSRPGLQNHQTLVDNELNGAQDPTSDRASLQGDCQYNSKRMTKGGDIYQGAKPLVCSKRGRLQALPSKYSDSVLQPWKKCARKVTT